jgi:predicted CoA-binding protein
VTTGDDVLRTVSSVLLVDWPSRDVPETLARAGYEVSVKGGPEPDQYARYHLDGDAVLTRPIGHPPEQAELIYCYRPLDELPGIASMAGLLGSRAIWYQSGLDGSGADDSHGCWMSEDESRRARELVEDAGLLYIDDVYIADRVRELGIG